MIRVGYQGIEGSNSEEAARKIAKQLKLSEYENKPYKRAKLIFPNSKPFYDLKNHLIGLGHMYIHDGNYIVSFTSKIISFAAEIALSLLSLSTAVFNSAIFTVICASSSDKSGLDIGSE